MCSLCIGVTPKRIVYDETIGLLTCDGVPIQRLTVTNPNARSPVYTGRRAKTCSLCGKPGHTRPKCQNVLAAAGAEDLL